MDVNMDLELRISSLHVIEGVESLPETNIMKKPGHPKGSTKAHIIMENKQKLHCVAEIAKVYNQKMNEAKSDRLTQVPRGYLKNLICKKKSWHFCAVLHIR
jgi:hypothetical protein